jgi:hypothetical protein
MKMTTRLLSILSIILGLFFIADNFFFHAITFDYKKLGIEWLNPYLDHWMIGLVFLLLGYLSIRD